jgi:hypothetical protein
MLEPEDAETASANIIEGEVIENAPQTKVVIDYGFAACAQLGALLQILVGFVIANAGIGTLPLGVLLVPLGFWLMLRGIRQARNSIRNATRT